MSPITTITRKIQSHYDELALMYRLFWGPHVHHGYWEGNEAPRLAQEKLIRRLVEKAQVRRGSRVLDIGCGIGGSSVWLSKNMACSVLGINVSPVQLSIAQHNARLSRAKNVQFELKDASTLSDMPSQTFDAIWIIECSEHLEDKQTLIRECSRLLKPGGVLAICAWLKGNAIDSVLLKEVCDSMICPNLGRMVDYTRWMSLAGFSISSAEDITRNVQKTWSYCIEALKKPAVRAFLKICNSDIRRFVNSFPLMLRAYNTGTMSYGMITGRKTISDISLSFASHSN